MQWIVTKDGLNVKDIVKNSSVGLRKFQNSAAFARPVPLTATEKAAFDISYEGECYIKCDSTDEVDYDFDIVRQSGHCVKEFLANPLLMWMHCKDSREGGLQPIGQSLGISKQLGRPGLPDRTLSVFAFTQGSAQTQLGKEIEALWTAGVIKSSSIGFTVQALEHGFKYLDAESGEKLKGNYEFLKSARKEDSLVNNPGNPSAGRLDLKSFSAYRKSLEQGLDTTQDSEHRRVLETMFNLCRKDTTHFDMSTPNTADPAFKTALAEVVGEAVKVAVENALSEKLEDLSQRVKTMGDQFALTQFDKAAPAQGGNKAENETVIDLNDPSLMIELN